MKGSHSRISPFLKQCFVVLGASINMSQFGLVMAFTSIVLNELRDEDSSMNMDSHTVQWFISIPSFAQVIGNLVASLLMAKLGRRWANLISVVIAAAGWVCIATATNINMLLLARLLQGLSIGISFCVTPVIIGEYSSPKHRGTFLFLTPLFMASATLMVRCLGFYLKWKLIAFIFVIVTLVDMLIVAMSPETPSWLAEQGRYEHCKKAFRWLRGNEENDELRRLLQTTPQSKLDNTTSLGNKTISSKKKFYKPVIIMFHLYLITQWCGSYLIFWSLHTFLYDLRYHHMFYSYSTEITLIEILIVISSAIAVFAIRWINRRTMLFTACGMNVFMLLVTAGYLYAKTQNILPSDNPWIGIFIIHALTMTISFGAGPMPITIAGEIFPMKYKSLSSGLCALFNSVHILPFILHMTSVQISFCLCAGIMTYCLTVLWFLLPETKDITLEDIEDVLNGDVAETTLPFKNMKGVSVKE